jgi:hypothetical protein
MEAMVGFIVVETGFKFVRRELGLSSRDISVFFGMTPLRRGMAPGRCVAVSVPAFGVVCLTLSFDLETEVHLFIAPPPSSSSFTFSS